MQRLRLRGAAAGRALASGVRRAVRPVCCNVLLGTIAPVTLLAFAATAAHAQAGPAPTSGGLTIDLREAIERTFARNKEITAYELRLEEQRGRVQQVGLLPNPELDLELEDLGGSGTYGGVERAQTTLSLGWVIEPTARRHRVAAARAGDDLILSETEILRLDQAAVTAQWFLSGLANQTRLENAADAVTLTEQAVDAIKRRTRAGRSPKADLTRAEAELAMAKLARDDVTHDLDVAYHRLAGQWGEIQPDFTRLTGDLFEQPEIASFADLEARLEHNPQLVRLAAERRVAEATLKEARAERWMSFRPSLGMRHYAATDDFAVVAGLGMPLPVFNRGQGRVHETRAAVARSHAETEAARVRVRASMFEAYEEMKHHLHRAEALREEVIPRLEAALDETRKGFERGRYGYIEWRVVQLELLHARSELVEASTSAHRLVVALERLTGGEVAIR